MLNENNKAELDEFIQKVGIIFEKIKDFYEEHNRNVEDDDRPEVSCPDCGKLTNNYICLWSMNKRVHFACPHCECFVRE
ncbi:hypothetical protein [Paenibacillus sp.]|uniref:hypothetical protein n=1 Tax=Paenibacillus sp. TaxID=58172 RepID=UPI0028B0F0D8|nr:hypothetical protein [Paenibacillus sp.]